MGVLRGGWVGVSEGWGGKDEEWKEWMKWGGVGCIREAGRVGGEGG